MKQNRQMELLIKILYHSLHFVTEKNLNCCSSSNYSAICMFHQSPKHILDFLVHVIEASFFVFIYCSQFVSSGLAPHSFLHTLFSHQTVTIVCPLYSDVSLLESRFSAFTSNTSCLFSSKQMCTVSIFFFQLG